MMAQPLIDRSGFLRYFTNSILFTMIVVVTIVVLARKATRRMQLIPSGGQNMFEAIVEALYDMLEGVVGKHMIPRVFSLLATLFIFILVSNWSGLLPGVGTIGWGEKVGPLTLRAVEHPLLRPTTADLNMTLAMALFFMVVWLYWTLTEVGPMSFILHLFAPKGGLKGLMAKLLLPIFIFVGIIEVISILFRPVSLSMRLFGNIFAGETLLHTMSTLGDKLPAPFSYILSVVMPLPFYFLELLVGIVQALVFMLLCAAYIALSTAHEEEEGH
jgi:F-type H+-transporting ATPase subunit a